MSAHIIIVEDDEDIAALVAFNLEREGCRCTLVHNGTEGWEQIRTQLPDCVILDMMLPGMTGVQIFAEMKACELTKNIPTLFLTARAQMEDKLECLGMGADDYITKPFSSKELKLRVRNLLHRANSGVARLIVKQGSICVDKANQNATLNGEPLELTTAEFKILSYLMERPDKVQDRYKLQQELLGYSDTTQTRALDTHIKRLRQKLGTHADCIATERGVGYYFSTQPTKPE
ncbi:MAG: response regulator transcription factor [Akkermansia sp.]|nr:response regulator transcription factor [Akkermansia sp.]